MHTLRRTLRWGLTGILILLLLASGGGYLWLRGSLPQTSGTITVRGLTNRVEIVRDTDAVPHIRAASEADALFGLGYAHAQDRLWQMEFQRRVANGRLAEFAGPSQLSADKFLRTIGMARAARSAWAHFGQAQRAPIEAYVAGINAYIATHDGRSLPVEFTILGIDPEPWQPEDVLVWGKMMAWDMNEGWARELLRAELIARVGAEKTSQLMPAYLAGAPIIVPDYRPGGTKHEAPATVQTGSAPAGSQPVALGSTAEGLLALNRAITAALGQDRAAVGSNNWVIGGARTTTGKPLLANDPHIASRLPAVWYLAHLTGGGLDVIGATMPGLPGVFIGHNRRIAWGITNTSPDVQDLYVEHINAQGQAEHNGAWEPLQIIPEVIKVKGQPDVIIQVRATRHGPLISDVVDRGDQALALRWASLDDQDTTFTAFLELGRAQSWADFNAALARYRAPMQNFVYADVDGNIGYLAPGAIPIRTSGDGTLPVPGWNDAHDWTGYVPFEDLPRDFNPPRGYIATANNPAMPDSYPYLITTIWEAPYRIERIIELIESKPKLSTDDVAAMQADVRSKLAPKLLPSLLRATPTDDRARAALALLSGWDAEVRGDSAAAAVYEAWYQQIPSRVFADELGEKIWADYVPERNMIGMALPEVLETDRGGWCDDVNTPARESCADTLGLALRDGLADMARAQGSDDIASWRWDRVHKAMFPHSPLDSIAALRPIFSRSIPNGGDGFTLNVAPVRPTDLYNQYNLPSYREIVDLSQLDSSRYMQPVGQSGNVLSRNYGDLIERWQRVEYLPMRFEPATIDQVAASRLILLP